MTNHGHILLEFLQVGAAELTEGDEEQDVDESMVVHKFALSEVLPLEDAIAQTCGTRARKERIQMLG